MPDIEYRGSQDHLFWLVWCSCKFARYQTQEQICLLNTSLSLSQDEHRNYGPDCMEIMEHQPKYSSDWWPKHPNCELPESFRCEIYNTSHTWLLQEGHCDYCGEYRHNNVCFNSWFITSNCGRRSDLTCYQGISNSVPRSFRGQLQKFNSSFTLFANGRGHRNKPCQCPCGLRLGRRRTRPHDLVLTWF